MTRICAWCRDPIPTRSRRDALTCSKRCRQARHRFVTAVGVAPAAAGQPRRIAYADPPYPGLSAKYYAAHPDYAGEVDHQQLIRTLSAEYDAWALSTSAYALQAVLALCPPGVRVAAWHRGERPNQAAVLPQNGWEPVILGGDIMRRTSTSSEPSCGSARHVAEDLHDASRTDRDVAVGSSGRAARPVARVLLDASRGDDHADLSRSTADATPGQHDASRAPGARRVDSLVYFARPRLTDPDRVIGAKPATFCRWLFELLAATAHDEFHDLYPGSGGVTRAWRTYVSSCTTADAS